MNAEDAWDALSDALENTTPACEGRALFTVNRLSNDERALCKSICVRCPLFVLCDAYALAAKVESGFWAGHSYSPKGRK
ncbi:transcription factor WhiB [Microbacterium sp. HM58-2]|nr:transcription factor WhiB [Microbacterium sp. HM58-2]